MEQLGRLQADLVNNMAGAMQRAFSSSGAPLLPKHRASDVAPPISSRRPAHADWSTSRVGDWLTELGLGEYADVFATHHITGDLLEYLTEEHLNSGLGMHLIGHRLVLMRELGMLLRRAAANQRTRVLWRGVEVVHREGPLGYMRDGLCCVPCRREPARYELSANALTYIESDNQLCPTHTRTTREVAYEHMSEVTAVHSSKCWHCSCQADDVIVALNQEVGLPPVPPLRVPVGTGEEVADIIRGAMEEAAVLFEASAPAPKSPMLMKR